MIMLGWLTENLFRMTGEKPVNYGSLRQVIQEIGGHTPDIPEEDLRQQTLNFVQKWLEPHCIENDFGGFAAELNELVLELGNAGYFDDLSDEAGE